MFNKFKGKSKIILFVVIILIAALLRFYQLGEFPSGFDSDEAAWGYNAYSILKTGADEYGVKLPIVLKSFGEYKGVLYSYFTIPFIYFLDLTPWVVRIPSVLFSLGSMFILYLITKELTKKDSIALLTMFFYAISPWSIILSRVVADFNLAFFFTLGLIYALLQLRKSFSLYWFVLAYLAGVASIFSYTASRFYVVIAVFIFLCLSLLKSRRLVWENSFLGLFVCLLLSGIVYTTFGTTERFSQISIFSSPATKLVMEEQIREDQFQHPIITRLFHNKVFSYSRTILENYNKYINLDFLFLSGGLPLRENISQSGLLYLWQLPFLLLGIYVLIKKHKFVAGIFASWLILLLIPSVITYDEVPNVHRSLIILPPMLITISIGFMYFFEHTFFKRFGKFLLIFLLVVIFFEFFYFLHQYFSHYPIHRPWYRGYAHRTLVDKLNNGYAHYKKVYMTKNQMGSYIYILFYGKWDPSHYQKMGSPGDFEDGKGFGKYIFIEKDCPLSGGKTGKDKVKGEEDVLYINRGDCIPPESNSKLIDVINWKDGNPAFQLVEYVRYKEEKSSIRK